MDIHILSIFIMATLTTFLSQYLLNFNLRINYIIFFSTKYVYLDVSADIDFAIIESYELHG